MVDIVVMSIRMKISPFAPNFDSNCNVGGDDIASCGQKLTANILVYVASHCFGIYFAHLSEKYTKKTYLKHVATKRERKTFQEQTKEAERIAVSILPQRVWNDLRGGHANFDSIGRGKMLLYSYPQVTVLFGDVVGFTNLASRISPQNLVMLLDSIFTQFDELVSEYGLEKIKTIGDCYMICGGTWQAWWISFDNSRFPRFKLFSQNLLYLTLAHTQHHTLPHPHQFPAQ